MIGEFSEKETKNLFRDNNPKYVFTYRKHIISLRNVIMKLTFSEILKKNVGVMLCDFGGLGYPNDALIPSVDKVSQKWSG